MGPLLFACILAANIIVDNAAVITAVTLTAAITLPWISTDTPTKEALSSPTSHEELIEHVSASLAIIDIGNGLLTYGKMTGATSISDDTGSTPSSNKKSIPNRIWFESEGGCLMMSIQLWKKVIWFKKVHQALLM